MYITYHDIKALYLGFHWVFAKLKKSYFCSERVTTMIALFQETNGINIYIDALIINIYFYEIDYKKLKFSDLQKLKKLSVLIKCNSRSY